MSEATVTSPTKVSESGSSSSVMPETEPVKPKRTLWGDEEEDSVEEGTDDAPPVPDIKSLKIEDELDDPADDKIEAVTAGDTPYTSAKSFEELNLSPELLKGIYVEMRFERPSKIQTISLPMILTPPYKNLIAQAHNGSGKTTCFVLGMLSRVDPKLQVPQALCICPTRELAIQNMEVLRKMGKHTGISSELAVPSFDSSVNTRTRVVDRAPVQAHVVIGTPGTIKKWISNRKLGLSYMKILVFDEADHMLAEDGFKDDSLRIMRDIGSRCQVLLFSATFNETVKNFVTKTIKDYNQMFVKKEELSLEALKQYKVQCRDELSKILVIKDKIFELGEKVGQTIIFVKTKESAVMLHNALHEYGYEVTTIQGACSLDDRDKIVKEFKDGLTQVLISTDILARGFDQSKVNVVVNYDLPVKHTNHYVQRTNPPEPDYEVYLHRIGRAGRFGRKGAVFNLLCHDKDLMLMQKIENHFDINVAEIQYDEDKGFENALKAAGLF